MTNMLNRTRVFLLVHVFILALLFSMKFLGVTTDVILLSVIALIAMESIYMAVFTKEATGKACQGVKEMAEEMAICKEAASETIKLQRALLYTGHQIKNIQGDLDVLKRKADYKLNGNGHHRRTQPVVSHV